MASLFPPFRRPLSALICTPWMLLPLSALTLRNLHPPSGKPGDAVVLSGDFDPGVAHTVTLGGVAAGGISVTADALTFAVPAGSASGDVVVGENGDQTTYPMPFLVSRDIAGVLSPPSGISPGGFKVVGGEGETAVAGDGSFTITVSTGKPTMLWAFKPGVPSTFLALVTDSDTNAPIDVTSTAVALAAANPLVGFRDSAQMDGVRADLRGHDSFPVLEARVAAAFAGGYDYLDDAAIDEPLLILARASPVPTPLEPAEIIFEDVGPGFPEVKLAELSPGGVPNIFDSKIVASPKRASDFLILENARTSRPNTVDWTMELFRLSPGAFPNGISDITALDGNSLVPPATSVPLQAGYERASLLTANLDVLGKLTSFVFETINGTIKGRTGLGLDPAKQNQFRIDRNVDEIYLLQSYSGNIPNGLGYQAPVLNAGDPNSQWAFALAGNLMISALDAAGVFADAKSITGIDNDFIANLNLTLAKTLSVYRGRGDLDVNAFLDLASAATQLVIKSYYANLVSEDTLTEIAPRYAKAIAKSFDIIGKVSSAAQAVERLTGLGFESTWAVERSLLIIGNPLQPFITRIDPVEAKAGQTVRIEGGNFSWDASELSVAFCDFNSTSGDVAGSVPATITFSSPTRIEVTVPDAATYRSTFPDTTSFLCVTKDGGEVYSTAADPGEFTMPPPPAIIGVEPSVVTSGAVISILGERFGPKTTVELDGFTPLPAFQKLDDRVVVRLPNLSAGSHTLTVSVGNDESTPFNFEVVLPADVPRSLPGGVSITVTQMTMTNQADGEISLLEAMLIANGTLGRPIEQHVTGEPAGTRRETDFVSGDDGFGLGGGAAKRDTITAHSTLGTGPFPINAALPPVTSDDRYDFRGAILDGATAPGGSHAFVLDGASDARINNVIIRNFPGDGIRLLNGTLGTRITAVTVDGCGGSGIHLENGSNFNTFTTLELLNPGGSGLNLEGDCDSNSFSNLQIDTTGGHGLAIDEGSDHNLFTSVTITGCGGDGLRVTGGSERNRFQTALEISQVTGSGLRLSGTGTRYNRFGDVPFSGGEAISVVPAVRDCGGYGVHIESGASYNLVAPRFVSNCTQGGVLITGAGTIQNTFGHPYRTFPGGFTENLFFSLVADNLGPGVTLAGGSSGTLVTGINLYHNDGDGILLDGSSFNWLLSNRSGVQDFIENTSPVASPSTGASVRLTNGSSNNVIGTVMTVVLSEFGSNGTMDFYNHFANDTGGGVIVENESDHNHIHGTRIGNVGFKTYHGRVGGPGVALLSGASGNLIGDRNNHDSQVFIGSCAGAAVLLDGPATRENTLAGLEIGSYETDPLRVPALGIHLRNGAKANQIGIVGPMDKILSFGTPRLQSVVVRNATGSGLWLEACGGTVGTDGAISDPNRIHNGQFSNCGTGILVSDDAVVNEIGGTRGGGPDTDGFVNFRDVYTEENNSISGSVEAGLRFSNMNVSSPLLRNVIRNLSIDGGWAPVPGSLDLAAGPPDGCGILINPDCSNVIIGEDQTGGIGISGGLVGAYIDGSDGHLLRSLSITGFGSTAAGIVIRGGSRNTIGQPGSGENTIKSIGANPLPSHGIALLDGADENTVAATRIAFGTGNGIHISESARNQIGGPGLRSGNEIIGHDGHGIEILGSAATGNRIQGNFIGIARDGTTSDPFDGDFGNLGDGVNISDGAHDNLIGGRFTTNAAGAPVTPAANALPVPAPNIVTASGGAGVAVEDGASTGNSILTNSIHDNGSGGIELRGDGNGNLPAPSGSYAVGAASGSVDAAVPVGSRVQIFSDGAGEGEVLIGETEVRAGGSWTAVSLAPTPFANVTATVTHATTGSTSPFALLGSIPSNFEIARVDAGAPGSRSTPFSTETVVHELRLTASGSDVRVRSLVLTAGGTLDDAGAVGAVRLVRDNDRDGAISDRDTVLGEGQTFDADDGTVSFAELSEVILSGEDQHWLVSYQPTGPTPADGTTFSLRVADATAVDAVTFLPAGLDVTLSNPFPVPSDQFIVGETPPSGFDTFIGGAFPGETSATIIGRTADPDRDGIINLLEWILGGDPDHPDAGLVTPRLEAAPGGELAFVFRRREGLPPGTTTEVTVSDFPGGFAVDPTVTGTPEVASNGDGTERVRVGLTRPPGQPRLLLRLEASEP